VTSEIYISAFCIIILCWRVTLLLRFIWMSLFYVNSDSEFLIDWKSTMRDRGIDEVEALKLATRNLDGTPKILLPPRNHADTTSSNASNDVSHTWGSQWRSMARASSIRSTRSNISPTAPGPDLNPARRTLSVVNRNSHQISIVHIDRSFIISFFI